MGKTRDVDHIDRVGFNNSLLNLRVATRSENTANSVKARSVAKYRGIYKNRQRWWAGVVFHGKKVRSGGFATQEDAALAYDEIAFRLWGNRATLNFPREAIAKIREGK